MDTKRFYRNTARLIPVAAASALVTVFGCVPVPNSSITKPDTQYFGGAETSSGDVYVTGYVSLPIFEDAYASSFVLRKFDAKQKMLWERQYPDPTQADYLAAISDNLPSDNAGKFIQIASDGSVYVAAKLQKPGDYNTEHANANYDVALLKYSASGDLLWTRYIDFLKKDAPTELQLDASGNVYLHGRSLKLTTPSIEDVAPSIDYYNEFITSFNGNGDKRWTLQFNKGFNSVGNMQFQSDGFYLAVASSVDTCGNLYKVDFAGHMTPVSPDPLAVCPIGAVIVGDHVVITPGTAGESKSMILPLDNLASVEATISWNALMLSQLHAIDGYTSPQYFLPDRKLPNSFFVLAIGSYVFNGPDTGSVFAPQLVHMNSKGEVLSSITISDAGVSTVDLFSNLRLAQTASGDVIVSSYHDVPSDFRGGNIYVVNYNSHAVTHYSFADDSLLSSITGLEAGQQPIVVGSQLVDGVWTPLIRRLDQAP